MQLKKNKIQISISIVPLIIGFVTIVTVGLLSYALFSPEEVQADGEKNLALNYTIVSPEIPEQLDFCGEPVPLDEFEVYERIDRELIAVTYRHSATIMYLKRAGRWFPMIKEILNEYGVPEDFLYLIITESGLENLVSPAKAEGYWQFLESTGETYGLEIYGEVDERYHIQKSTIAACKYLKDAYKDFKSWTLAAAAYNAGFSGVSKRMSAQKVSDYWDIHLVSETARYVPRILAHKIVFGDPAKYGFRLDADDLYQPLKTRDIIVKETIEDLAEFAISRGTTYKMLRYLNPWLRSDKLTISEGNSYVIKLPM